MQSFRSPRDNGDGLNSGRDPRSRFGLFLTALRGVVDHAGKRGRV